MAVRTLLRPVALGAAIAVAPLAAGCERLPANSQEVQIGSVDDLCTRTGEIAPLTDHDGEVLPPLDHKFVNAGMVGKLVVKNGHVSLYLSPLPEDTKTALVAAVDPFVACTEAKLGGVAEIVVSGQDGGDYTDNRDKVTRLDLTTSTDPQNRRLPERAAPRIVLNHEALHKYVAHWINLYEAGKLRSSELLDGLSQTYKEELYDAAEDFRQQRGQDIISTLTDMKGQVKGNSAHALQALIERFQTAGGLKDVSLDCSRSTADYCVRNNFAGLIKESGAQAKAEVDDDSLKPFADQLKIMNEAYWASLEKSFPIDESSILSKTIHNWRAGHPYDNFNEWVVSLMNSMRFNHEGVSHTILGLSVERQVRYGNAIKMLFYIATKNDPILLQALPFEATQAPLEY